MRTFETPEPISATIDVAVGDVRISAVDGSATTVDVQPTDASSDEDVKVAELTRVEYANGELRVKAPKLRSWSPRSAGGSIVCLRGCGGICQAERPRVTGGPLSSQRD